MILQASASKADELGQAFVERITAVIEPQLCTAISTLIQNNIQQECGS